jgi:hypothetical protein
VRSFGATPSDNRIVVASCHLATTKLTPQGAARHGTRAEQLVTGFEEAEKAADALAEQLRLRATTRLRALHCAGVGGPPNPHAQTVRSERTACGWRGLSFV